MFFYPIHKSSRGLQYYNGYPIVHDDDWDIILSSLKNIEVQIDIIRRVTPIHGLLLWECDGIGNDIPYNVQNICDIHNFIKSKNIKELKKQFPLQIRTIQSLFGKIKSNQAIQDWISDQWNLFNEKIFGLHGIKESPLIDKAPKDRSGKRLYELCGENFDLWDNYCIISYICKKYEDYYAREYSYFGRNGLVPSKSREMYEIKKLQQQISTKPSEIKKYIDWFFDNILKNKKTEMRSFAFLTHQDIVNQYKVKFIFNKKIERTSSLPSNVISLCSRHGFDIKTYAELAFIKKMPNQDQLFKDLLSIDFKIDILDKIA